MRIIEIKNMRDKALKAYSDALEAQSLGMNGRNLTRQNIDTLKTQLDYWERRYSLALKKGKSKPYSLVKFTGA
jgi:hypothetical protein